MKYTISVKNFNLSDKTLRHIIAHIHKINIVLSDFAQDLVSLDFVLRKNRKKRLDYKAVDTSEEDGRTPPKELIALKSPAPIYYNGTIKMVLPNMPLVAHLKGITVDKAIDAGFTRLFKKIKGYKGKHFSNNSEYFDRKTIRKNMEFTE